ncbi:MAG: FAD-binding protein [Nitrospirae bacterium]|nr:FAD-binding protein [Nitrospirota bacterium]
MPKAFLLDGIQISSDMEDLVCYGFDSSIAGEGTPVAVAWPRNTDDVARIIRYAAKNNLNVIPRGAGTGMAGGSVPVADRSMVISLEKMRKIIDIDEKNLCVEVEPGVINGRLQRELRNKGFFYPPDPASLDICTIGGNVATNAGGARAIKYGVTRDYVMGIEAVLSDGNVINTGSMTHKHAVGYDLKDLLVGSEGTLAVMTRIRLKMLPSPEDVVTLMALFNGMDSTGEAAAAIRFAKITPRAMEFMDSHSIRAVENYSAVGLPDNTAALLIIELDGNPAAIKKEAARIVDICSKHGGEVIVAADKSAQERLWEARRAVSPALYRLKPSRINEDIVVPLDKVSAILKRLRTISDESGVEIICFGHAGDGNIHVNIMSDTNNEDERLSGLEIAKRVLECTLELGGSISGEHGIGVTKKPFIGMEIKERELELMRAVKRVFDPSGVMNPGKIFS